MPQGDVERSSDDSPGTVNASQTDVAEPEMNDSYQERPEEAKNRRPSSSLEKSDSYRLETDHKTASSKNDNNNNNNNESTSSMRRFSFNRRSFRRNGSAATLGSSARSLRKAMSQAMHPCSFRRLRGDPEAGLSEEMASIHADGGTGCCCCGCVHSKLLFVLGALLSAAGIYALVKKFS